jgi:osmotically-inducible protein OsmY
MSQVIEGLGIDRDRVDVRVRNGTVTLSGAVDAELIPRVNEEVARIPDVYEVVDRLIAR